MSPIPPEFAGGASRSPSVQEQMRSAVESRIAFGVSNGAVAPAKSEDEREREQRKFVNRLVQAFGGVRAFSAELANIRVNAMEALAQHNGTEKGDAALLEIKALDKIASMVVARVGNQTGEP